MIHRYNSKAITTFLWLLLFFLNPPPLWLFIFSVAKKDQTSVLSIMTDLNSPLSKIFNMYQVLTDRCFTVVWTWATKTVTSQNVHFISIHFFFVFYLNCHIVFYLNCHLSFCNWLILVSVRVSSILRTIWICNENHLSDCKRHVYISNRHFLLCFFLSYYSNNGVGLWNGAHLFLRYYRPCICLSAKEIACRWLLEKPLLFAVETWASFLTSSWLSLFRTREGTGTRRWQLLL